MYAFHWLLVTSSQRNWLGFNSASFHRTAHENRRYVQTTTNLLWCNVMNNHTYSHVVWTPITIISSNYIHDVTKVCEQFGFFYLQVKGICFCKFKKENCHKPSPKSMQLVASSTDLIGRLTAQGCRYGFLLKWPLFCHIENLLTSYEVASVFGAGEIRVTNALTN